MESQAPVTGAWGQLCVLALGVLLAACEHTPDLSVARARAAEPLQAFDTVHAMAADNGQWLAATQTGAILRSTDQGGHWQRTLLPGASLLSLERCPDGSFIALDFHHRIWSAPSSATAWTPHALPEPANALALHCAPDGRWWVAGSRATLAVSADQGASWDAVRLKEDTQITTLQFLDAHSGFALGEFGTVLATHDAGASWQRLPKIDGDFYPYAAWFTSAQEGYASGLAGVMLATHDGGLHWQREDNATGAALYRLFPFRGETWAVGAGGAVARHVGSAWQAVAVRDASPIPLFAAAGTGEVLLAGGPGGTLHRLALAVR